ncbi:MAG: M1 family aminopeptidase, partial [Rhodothermales bacterium]
GIKMAETQEANKTVVIWETTVPVTVINVMAGQWAVESTYVADVTDSLGSGEDNTAVYYHPAHDYNMEEIMDALVAARQQYSEWFYPYPWGDLRINEFPNLDQNATGFPINISFSEGVGFLTKPEPGAYLPFVVAAHEVAHQWWGHILSPAEGPGADFLIEGMANYSSLLLLESEKGDAARRTFSRYMERQYVRSRRIDSEIPLIMNNAENSQGESVAYNKGAWVMWMLRSQLGEVQMMDGLKSFVGKNALRDDALPDLKELIHIFRSAAPDSSAFALFEDQWFNHVVLPEFRLTHVEIKQEDAGWKVQATIENVGTGIVEVDVAAVEEMPDLERGEPDYSGQAVVKTLRLTPGQPVTFDIEAGFKPEGLVVDPHVMMLQVNREKAMFGF